MNSLFHSGLGTPQTYIPLVTSFNSQANSQAINLYESQQSSRYVREHGFPTFISNNSTDFDLELYTQGRHNGYTRLLRAQLMNIQLDYALVSDERLITEVLADVPTLYSLLKAAVQPLRLTFGETKLLLQIEALESDEDTILRVMVRLPSDTAQPAELMRTFKRDWWLQNCSRSEASLVFDYETGDAF
jgi:hypothetical protein